MLANCWQQIDGIELKTLPLPVSDWNRDPSLKKKITALISDLVEIDRPDFILDVNGAGILPVDEEFKHWTTEEVNVPWVEWWWDDPANIFNNYVNGIPDEAELFGWINAMKSSNVCHFCWDKVLGQEFSRWLEIPVHYLPTATHPGFFNPEAANLSKRVFSPVEVSFLGYYYGACEKWDGKESQELDFLIRQRISEPELDYFEIVKKYRDELELFGRVMRKAKISQRKVFDGQVNSWRNAVNLNVGLKRRNEIINEISANSESAFFAGYNWPDHLGCADKIYQPVELVNLFQATLFNLDFLNGQSFTGTNMRCYEIMSAGGILVLTGKNDLDPDDSLAGQVYLKYESPEQFAELKKEYPRDSKKLIAMRDNARSYVIEKHSWLTRFKTILEVLNR
jgi:hypothetical protein